MTNHSSNELWRSMWNEMKAILRVLFVIIYEWWIWLPVKLNVRIELLIGKVRLWGIWAVFTRLSNLYCQLSASFFACSSSHPRQSVQKSSKQPDFQATYPLTHHFSCFQGRQVGTSTQRIQSCLPKYLFKALPALNTAVSSREGPYSMGE